MNLKMSLDSKKNMVHRWNRNASVIAIKDFRFADLSAGFKISLNDLMLGFFVLQRNLLICANKMFLRQLGYENESELRGKPFEGLIFREDREKFKFNDWKNPGDQIDNKRMLRICTKDNRLLWAHICIKTLPCKTDDLHLGYILDVTQIKRNNDNITASLKKYRTILDDMEDSSSLILDDDWKPSEFQVIRRDVSEPKETEEKITEHHRRLEAIFTSVEDAIIAVDPQLNVIEANKATENICGVPVQNMIGRPFHDCPNNCSQSCIEVIRMTLEKKTTIKDFRVNCVDHGQQQTVGITSSPLLNQEGKFGGAVLRIRNLDVLNKSEPEMCTRHRFHNIIGQSEKMRSIYNLVENLADIDTTVLISGESGTGKELVAKALHYSGSRAAKPFVAVNCSALSESLLESELFGHIKGAFTGAIKSREGRFQSAGGGTILIDEIGDISPLIQVKLLRVLQEKTFERVGDTVPQKVDVRIIACTNKDLKKMVKLGEFREDLYYRLKVVEIDLPPLREREGDMALLVNHFHKMFNERFSRQVEAIDQEILDVFMNYSWPGNVRELEHVLEHAFVLSQDNVITLGNLPAEFRKHRQVKKSSLRQSLEETITDANLIRDALRKTKGNKSKAARLLGISRQTIYRKIDQYQISPNM